MRKVRVLLCVVATLGALYPAAAAGDRILPDFTLTDMDGGRLTLSELWAQGPVLVNFWATWCVPCCKELPHLQRFLEEYGPRGFQVVVVAEDGPRTASKVKPYMKGHGYEFRVALDTEGEVRRLYHASTLPYSVLADEGGAIVFAHSGYRAGEEAVLEEEIGKILPGPSEEALPDSAGEIVPEAQEAEPSQQEQQ
jgi:cytochrome c biogenesis protein CcmG/thiol:disulfide interchange protein DsbE